MMILLTVVLVLVAIVVAIVLIGLALPAGHIAARRATLAVPPAAVWRALVDIDAHPQWRRGVSKIERISATSFREHSRHGAITFAIDVDEAPHRRVTRIADDQLPFGGRWIYELAPDASGTRLTITEDGVVKQPIFRFLSKTVFSQTATLERFLVELGAHLGTPAIPEPAEPDRLMLDLR